LPWGDRLIISVYDYYDAAGAQVLSHLSRPLQLDVKGQVSGPFQVGPLGAGYYSGYMGVVPTEWQAKLGGPALTGQADINIITRTSLGPDAFVFDPANLNGGTAKPLVYYPTDHATLGAWAQSNPLYGGADTMKGVVFPKGTSSMLFFGKHGTTFCYGIGTS